MMSRRSSRPSSAASHSSRSSNMDGEFKLECKAAYLSVLDDIRDEITSQDDFMLVLQQAGRNPSRRTLEKYWKDDTVAITFNEFVDICRREHATTADDLMKAFRKIDVNGDGYISLDELFNTLTTKGDRMSRDEVKVMIDEVDENKDGRLDYSEEKLVYMEFCNMLMKTTEESKKMSIKIMERKERKKQRNRPSITPRKDEEGDIHSSRTSLRSGSTQLKNEGGDIRSSRTSLRSGSIQLKNEDGDIRSSRTSLRSGSIQPKNEDGDIRSSRTSLCSGSIQPKNEDGDIRSSRTSLRSGSIQPKNEEGDIRSSRTSLHSGSIQPKNEDTSIRSSRTSLRSGSIKLKDEDEDIRSSRTSLRSGSLKLKNDDEDILSSRTSLRSGSLQLKSTADKMGSQLSISSNSLSVKASDRRGSKASIISIDDLPKASPRMNREHSRQPVKARLSEPSKVKDWAHVFSKGCFFLEDDKIISHQYTLDLPSDSNVWITISPLKIGEGGVSADGYPIDTALFILREKRLGERLTTFTEQRDTRGKYGVRCDLEAGRYELIPFSTGCRLRPGKPHKPAPKLVQKDKHNEYVLTKAFKKALDEIFDMADLDGNGLLSREELNLYTWRTSGEEVVDEEWAVVEANCDLESGEITKAGFIHLTEMEAQDGEGEDKDLWITLENMGYNKSLVLSEACPFKIDVYSEECDDVKLKVSTLEPTDDHVDEAVCESVVSKGESAKIKGMRDLTLYNYISDARATFAVKNGSSTKVIVELDCKNSRNCISHRGELRHEVTVPGHTTVIGHHLLPDDEKSEWTVRCTERIVK